MEAQAHGRQQRARGINLSRMPLFVQLCVLLIVAVLALNLVLLWRIGGSPDSRTDDTKCTSTCTDHSTDKPVVWVYAKAELPMSHVVNVFDRLGYMIKEVGSKKWDVMWAHQYPFLDLHTTLTHLQPHQKVNHFPGTSCFVSKPVLATHGFAFTPKAFKIPDEAAKFKLEVSQRPNVLWLQKSNMHRGIRIKSPDEISIHSRGTFVQEFLTNPYLIDGRKFDIGVYVTITSINPLRVYLYSEETLIRFCSKEYEPFDVSDTKRYVVDDHYTPVWEIPSLRQLVMDHKLSHSEALNEHLKQRGHNSTYVWEQTTNIIKKVLYHCEQSLIKKTMEYPSTRNFFELIRFDFVVDAELRVWLMEVNLSPNLSSSHTIGNRVMYEQVVFNVLSLVGLARATGIAGRYNGQYESIMTVSDQNIQVPLNSCTNGSCADCKHLLCKLCSMCRSNEESLLLKTAFLEHVNRRNFIRIIPPPSHVTQHSNSTANYLMEQWFDGKCRQNPTWCS